MPLIVLLAIFLTMAIPEVDYSKPPTTFESTPSFLEGIAWLMGGILVVGLVATVLGNLMAYWFAKRGITLSGRMRLRKITRGLDLLALGIFATLITTGQWRELVQNSLGLNSAVLIDETLVFLPFVLMQLAAWGGLYNVECAVRPLEARPGFLRHLILKARQAYGLVLPVAALLILVQDVGLFGPSTPWPNPWVQVVLYAIIGGLILVLSPAFVRLSWPSSSLPPGPLRDRLEVLAHRLGFRFSDIRVWDTGGSVVNAGVTGILPGFRYVLISDAMVDHLHPLQVEAVFGHEVGHIAHRHLPFFGLFLLGSIGVMALVGLGIEQYLVLEGSFDFWGDTVRVQLVLQAVAMFVLASLYFWLVFGFVSRQFERQADVFGCISVSCDRPDCPPHPDVNGMPAISQGHPEVPCPVGIGIFIEALSNVAVLNGIESTAYSWRHGSISRRVSFLRNLEGDPNAVERFQQRVNWLRIGVGIGLIMALLIAIWTGAIAALS